MTFREPRLPARLKRLAVLPLAALTAAVATLGASPQQADAYWVCPPAAIGVNRPAFFVCAHDSYRPSINYIEKESWQRAYAVYRSAYYGGPSVSGSEFYSPTQNYFIQLFHCNPGFPNARNRHSITVTVSFTRAGSC